MAHGLDPETGRPFNGILSSWEQSKPYHHGVKGRGTVQFAMPTLLEAQCKLFDVLFAAHGVDGSGFYAAVGGLGGGEPGSRPERLVDRHGCTKFQAQGR